MNHPFSSLLERRERTVLGIMSGTSLDGIDLSAVRLSGSGTELQITVLAATEVKMDDELRSQLLSMADSSEATVRDVTLLSTRLSMAYEEAIREALPSMGLKLQDIDAIGLHGQTVYHHPEPTEVAGRNVAATLQIGDASVLANRIGLPVVGDFRPADMALGGQGAPLVPYFDYVCFRSDEEGRLMLNLGGMANVTVLPSACGLTDVLAFDTGPANVLLDILAVRLFGERYDRGGELASKGRFDEGLVAQLMEDEYFSRPPPKSTGREYFSSAFADYVLKEARNRALSDHDVMATATALTVQSIGHAFRKFVFPTTEIHRVIVSGGGVHNEYLMRLLASELAELPVESSTVYGVDADAKEAVCFAVLAHETLNGVQTSVPSATGADRATILGKICIPGIQIHPGS